MSNRLVKLLLSLSLVLTLLLSSVPALASSPDDTADNPQAVPALASSPVAPADTQTPASGTEVSGQVKEVHQVTLITGDAVTMTVFGDGKKSFAIAPADPGKLGQRFLTVEQNGATYIYPDGVDFQKLDMELFNIDYLVDEQYYQQPNLPLLVSYLPGLPAAEVQSLESELEALGQETELQEEVGVISTQLAYQDIAPAYDTLLSQPDISRIWLDKKFHAQLSESVPLIGAPSWWASGYNGTGVKIAILDTGIDSSHPALNDLDDNPSTIDPKVIVNTNYTDDINFNDLFGHGTHVAGIAAGTGAGGNYTGVAPGAWLWNVKVLNQYGYGYSSWIINGINFASLGADGVAATGDEANIISMSLGGGVTDGTDPLSQAVNLAVDRGVVVIVAAGNSGSGMSTVSAPGVAAKAITVGASSKDDTLAGFSSRGPTLDFRIKPDILAPGFNIVSSVTTNNASVINDPSGYKSLSGTSMATPHVAGAAALLLQRYSGNATPQLIKDTLMSTAKDIGYDVYKQGSGRLDLTSVMGQKVGVTPASLSLGRFNASNTTASANFTFYNSDNISHQVTLSANLTDVFSGDSYLAGPHQLQWQKTIGGINRDWGYSVQQTADGGYVLTGFTTSLATNEDVYLVKTDSSGNVLWNRTFGGASYDFGYAIQQTMDSGYIIVGSTRSFGTGSRDVYLIKTDASGNLTWSKTFGGAEDDEGWSVRQTADGGYIVSGDTWSFGAGAADVYLIKTDDSGNMTWTKTYGGIQGDHGYSLQLTSDGGYIITGETFSFGAGSQDVYLIKTDASGNMTWQKTFGGANEEFGRSVQPTEDGGYIIDGLTDNLVGTTIYDVYLIKTDSSGNMTWSKTFGGTDQDRGHSIQPTADGGYIIGGTTSSFGAGNYDAYIIKTDSSGNMTWSKTFGGSSSDQAYSIQQTADGGYIITGFTASFGAGEMDVYLIKLAPPVVDLTPATFTIPAGGQVQVNLNINLAALPASLYSGKVTATVDNATAVHAIFGFSKMNQITLHKTDVDVAPAQGHPVWVMVRDQSLNVNEFYGYTNQSGNVTFYLPDGSYDLISPNWGSKPELPGSNPTIDIWTISENLTVTGDMTINLDERDTKVTDFNPNKPGLIPAAKSLLLFYHGIWSSGWTSSWYYPQSFVFRISPISDKFDASFNYSAYPQVDFDKYGPGLVNTGEWLNLRYPLETITDNITFTADYSNLVHRNTAYGVALNGERAYLYQSSSDNTTWFSTGFSYLMDAPQVRSEWLSPSPVWYNQYYRRYAIVIPTTPVTPVPPPTPPASDPSPPPPAPPPAPVVPTGPAWAFSGGFGNPSGNWSATVGFHPFTSGLDVALMPALIGQPNPLYVWGAISRDSAGNSFSGQGTGLSRHLKVTANSTSIILEKDIGDYLSEPLGVPGNANFTIEVWGQTGLALSRASYTRLDFDTGLNHEFRPPQITSIIVPSINASGIVPGGPVKVQVMAYDESQISSVRLSYKSEHSDNETPPAPWIDAGVPTLESGAYVFSLSPPQQTFVSLAIDAADQYGNHIKRVTDRAFYVGLPATQVSIDAPARVVPGSNFTVGVYVNQVENLDAASYDVSFDPAVLALDSVTAGLIKTSSNLTVTVIPVDIWNQVSPGRFTVVQNVPGLAGVDGSGDLAVLHFRVIGALGASSNITLSNGVLSNNLAEGIPAAWIGDFVQVSVIPGDATGDGLVNALDITKVERIIAKLDFPTPGADANQDGGINALDITKVERFIARLDQPLASPPYGGALNVAITAGPTNFDSALNFSSGALGGTVYEQYMGSDWRRSPAGGGVNNFAAGPNSLEDLYGPQLSTSWTMPEPGVWILQIRQGVHWRLTPIAKPVAWSTGGY